MDWILDNWQIITAVAVAIAGVDGIAGLIPDKWLPYVGIIRRVITAVVKVLVEARIGNNKGSRRD